MSNESPGVVEEKPVDVQVRSGTGLWCVVAERFPSAVPLQRAHARITAPPHPSQQHFAPLQGMVLASDSNLRTLYCTADEVAHLLLAAERLKQLCPTLAVDKPLQGGVVACVIEGCLVLRRVVAVERVVLAANGELCVVRKMR